MTGMVGTDSFLCRPLRGLWHSSSLVYPQYGRQLRRLWKFPGTAIDPPPPALKRTV
jgi:hypothetical protein